MENPFQPEPTKYKMQRSQMLTLLCILTFIGSGLNFLSALFTAVFFDQIIVIINSTSLPDAYSEIMTQMIVLMEKGGAGYYAASAVLYAGSLVGAIFMLNLKKNGFHIYTVSQILLLLLPIPFKIMQGFPLAAVLFTALFVALYYLEMRKIPSIIVKEENIDEQL